MKYLAALLFYCLGLVEICLRGAICLLTICAVLFLMPEFMVPWGFELARKCLESE